jgi:signal transduction histidine kinase
MLRLRRGFIRAPEGLAPPIALLFPAMFGAALVVLLALLAVSFADALASRRQAEATSLAAAADRDAIDALRNLRQERGTVREALRSSMPPSSSLTAGIRRSRERQQTAVASLLRRCPALDCGVRRDELIAAGEAVAAVRARVDEALSVWPWQPNPNLAEAWQPVVTRMVDLVAAIDTRLDRRLRRADAFVVNEADLAATAWQVRDVAGHERAVFAAAIRAGTLGIEQRLALADYRARVAAGWARLERAIAEPDAEADLVAAVDRARAAYFGAYAGERDRIERSLLAGEPPGPDAEDRLQASLNDALDSMAGIMDSALDAIERHMTEAVADARRRAAESAAVCSVALLLGLCGLVLLQVRVVAPIKTMTRFMQRFTEGRLDGPIPFEERTDEIGTLARALARFRAVTREKSRIEEHLQHTQRLESLGTLAAGITHELNNALTPVVSLSERLLRRPVEPGFPRQQLVMIHDAALRARDLVGRILVFARRSPSEQRPLDLAAVTRNALNLLRATLPANVAVEQRIEPVPPVIGDEGQLGQVIVNLVTNAAHAIGAGPGTITVRLASAAAMMPGDAATVRLSIADTGCGMSEETRHRAFDPFFTTKPAGQGTGLGLSVVHGIVTAHRGRITVESAPGEGTRFDIDLPLATDGPIEAGGRRPEPPRHRLGAGAVT